LIVVLPPWCATAGDRRSVGPEKKRKVSNCLLFVSVLNFLLVFSSNTPYFSSVGTPSLFLFCRLVRRTQERRSNNGNSHTGRASENKRFVCLVFSPRFGISSYPNSRSFACSFLVRRFWLIVVFPSSCAKPATATALCEKKKRKVSNYLLFVSVLKFLLVLFLTHLLFL